MGVRKIISPVTGAVLILMLLRKVSSQDQMYPVEPKGFIWTPPANETNFIKEDMGAKYVGLLFAGVSEFNWIVDVRLKNASQGYTSIGNLVTYFHVLTTCRAARLMLEKSKYQPTKSKEPEHGWEVQTFDEESDIQVTYCRNYLHDGVPSENKLDGNLTGVRDVMRIVLHPKCSRTSLLDDVAIAVLLHGISAVVPRVGYIPLNIDYRLEKTKPTGPDYFKETSLCYVASYGRGYYNLKNDPSLGFKLKYRVYLEKWKTCTDVYDYICNGYDEEQCKDKVEDSNILCFSARAKVGVVCDHDKGAPVVCQGEVVGIVVRGAKPQHCNNLYHIPFIALKIDGFKTFLDQTIEWLDRPLRKYDDVEAPATTKKPHGGTTRLNSALLMCLSAMPMISVLH